MALGDLSNDYFKQAEAALGDRKTPKTVYAALAYSIALRLCEDDHERAKQMLREEWRALHAAGLVPQKPSKEAR